MTGGPSNPRHVASAGGGSGTDRVRAHVWVSGRVQGVCFRAYAEEEARISDVGGWVRNTPDGRVEAVFEGDRSGVEAMIQWCHRGSPSAVVAGVEVKWEEAQGERAFTVRH
jgi:acylphosphatase